jgi:hypothetical protein
MAVVSTMVQMFMVTFVHVQMVLMVLNANLTINLVNQIHVGIMVYILSFLYHQNRNPQLFFFFLIGTCNETSETTFNCTCESGWEGNRCEIRVDYCFNVTCQNKGVCRPSLLNYTCECLGTSYSGRHCEIRASKIIIYTIVSKSFAYIAIIAITFVAMFIVIMDILKYCFGIDPTREDLEIIRRKKLLRKRKPVIQRFIYVNAPPAPPPVEESIATITETAV